jgi:hypothetical protein
MSTSVSRYKSHLHQMHLLSMEVARLGSALLRQSLNIAGRMERASRGGPNFGELAGTYVVLDGLKNSIPKLEVIDLGGTAQETLTGADWEWWIQGRHRWFHIFVQAKRAQYSAKGGGTYSLGQRIGNSARLQVDALGATAIRLQVPAIYALYNWPPARSAARVRKLCGAAALRNTARGRGHHDA